VIEDLFERETGSKSRRRSRESGQSFLVGLLRRAIGAATIGKSEAGDPVLAAEGATKKCHARTVQLQQELHQPSFVLGCFAVRFSSENVISPSSKTNRGFESRPSRQFRNPLVPLGQRVFRLIRPSRLWAESPKLGGLRPDSLGWQERALHPATATRRRCPAHPRRRRFPPARAAPLRRLQPDSSWSGWSRGSRRSARW
jgi:hypothetical protein